MKRKTRVAAGLVILVVVILLLYIIPTFELFPVKEHQLMHFKTETSTEFRVIYIGSNATTGEVIQIKMLDDSNKESLLAVYEGYNYIASFGFMNSTVKVVLGQAGITNNSLDTFYVNIE